MKVSDYMVDFFLSRGIKDVFGYPGGMVTHLIDSFSRRGDEISAHVNYHEQASAFCACGYAQVSGLPGIAYATSGPGATNLITGIANAFFDSIPGIFLTGQVNTFEAKGDLPIRQKGFQETDILSMVKGITKYCVYISQAEDIRYELEKAWYLANEGRKGPVLLDIPMNVLRSDVDPDSLPGFEEEPDRISNLKEKKGKLCEWMRQSRRPVLLIGAGVKSAGKEEAIRGLAKSWGIPVVSSMLAFDVFPKEYPNYFGFIGAYGTREANFIVAKSDLILSVGSRLDVRQVGARAENFGGEARIVRMDVDPNEFSRKIREDELEITCGISEFVKEMEAEDSFRAPMEPWLTVCNEIRKRLEHMDEDRPNKLIGRLSEKLPEDLIITTDVGQNQVWVAQSFWVKEKQRVLFSGGHGAMGYSLPAAIGAYYGSRKPVVCLCGDGGIQMNIQELQFLARERLPILIVILNNCALGMIRHFQEMYFDSNYAQTMEEGGYTVPEFGKIAWGYGLDYHKISTDEDMEAYEPCLDRPQVVEICLENPTYVFPKLEFGKPNQDQEPLLDRKLYQELMDL